MSFEKEVPTEVAQNLISKLLECKENLVCVDCRFELSTHCSVPHGTFVCNTCAEIHRNLPFFPVKGLRSDQWSLRDLKFLVSGGNQAFIEFFSFYSLEGYPIEMKYKSKAAYFYREVLSILAFGGCFEGDYPSAEEGVEIFEEIELGDLSNDSTFHSMVQPQSKWNWIREFYKSYPNVSRKSLQVVDESVRKIREITRVDHLVSNARRSFAMFNVGRVTDEMQKIIADVERYVVKGGEYFNIVSACTNPKRNVQEE
jgi:hypothetical protein